MCLHSSLLNEKLYQPARCTLYALRRTSLHDVGRGVGRRSTPRHTRRTQLRRFDRQLGCCAQGRSAAAQQPSRADLAKAMVKFGLPTLSISLADPAMSLVDTVVIGALLALWLMQWLASTVMSHTGFDNLFLRRSVCVNT